MVARHHSRRVAPVGSWAIGDDGRCHDGLDVGVARAHRGRSADSGLCHGSAAAEQTNVLPDQVWSEFRLASTADPRHSLRARRDRCRGVSASQGAAPVTRQPISRRRTLALLTLGTASTAVGATGWITGLGAPRRGRLSPADTGQALGQPEVMASSSGVLDVRLTAAPGVRLAGHDTSACGYNGTSPGPTLRLRPGDVLRVQLVNRLDQSTNP